MNFSAGGVDGMTESPPVEETNLQVTPGQVRYSAMSLLARREHSRFELKQKLSLRFPDSPHLESVLQQLADEALQSDHRFAEAFVAMRVRKGKGPIRIRLELEQRRIEPDLIDASLLPYRDQWATLAKEVCRKKFQHPPTNISEKSKHNRFLQYRGFSGEHIQLVWKQP